MNCAPNDLAVVVRGRPECNLGKIIRVTRIDSFSSHVCGTDMWEYEGGLTDHRGLGSVAVADNCLKPIRDPGDDAVDEMVRGVSCERTRTGEVAHG